MRNAHWGLAAAVFILTTALGSSFGDPPSSFDLRDVDGVDYVTSVRNQTGGTCWAHGIMAAMEGNLLMTGNWAAAGETGEPNLAEYHLDWWNGFNQHNNDDTDPPTGGGLEVHNGGDYRVGSAYLTRNEGAVFSEAANDPTEYDDNWYSSPPDRYDPSYHYYYARDIEWYVAGWDLGNIDTIKNKIMTEGVMGTCLCYSGSFMSNYVHYQPSSDPTDPKHAVAIVGWDDDKTTQAPEGPGAWLCKNSWGSSWGLSGYFWISYYDKHSCQHPEMGAVSFQDVEPLAYDHAYYHDYHGWRDTKTDCTEAFNAFIAGSDELLQAVSFFTADDNVTYAVKVYGGFEGGELLDELAAKSGTIEYSGLHTVDLDMPVGLAAGDGFYLYLALSVGGHPFDRTSDVPVLLGASYRTIVESVSHAGESYYRSGSTWEDLYDFEFSDPSWDHTANFCIKGLTTDRGLRVSPAEDLLSSGDVGGPFSPSSMVYQLENRDAQPIDYEVTRDATATWVTLSGDTSGTLLALGTAEVTVEINSNAEALDEGAHVAAVHFTNTSDHIGDTTRQVVLSIGDPILQYEWTLDSDPGWTTGGQWAFGVPTGQGSHNGDPTSGFTGSSVYGYNLNGDYEDDLPATYLTTGAIDCSEMYNVSLEFHRWLGVESNSNYDEATVEVSNDGTNWTVVWRATDTGSYISDSSWQPQAFNIASVTNGQPEVYIRWGMGPTDGYTTYPGWNIDDIRLYASVIEDIPGDFDGDRDVDADDFAMLVGCIAGPGESAPPDPELCSGGQFAITDVDGDNDVDMADYITFHIEFTGSQ